MKYGNRSISIWKTIISSPISLIVLVIFFAVLAKATWNIRQKSLISSSRLNQARVELIKLEMRGGDLESKIGRMSTEQGIEAELRTKYRATKEGEMVAVIVDDESSENSKKGGQLFGLEGTGEGGSGEVESKESETWLRKLLKYIW